MARVIHATTMKPTIAKPCLVTGSSGSGENHTASGTRMQRICPTMTRREFGFSSNASVRYSKGADVLTDDFAPADLYRVTPIGVPKRKAR